MVTVASDAATQPAKKSVASELVVVGTGIQVAAQATLAAERALRSADLVLFAVTNPWAARWIRDLNGNARSFSYPRDGRPRQKIYQEMVSEVLAALRMHRWVCAAFYGSPTLLTFPAHESVRQARAQGFKARMLPGVSSVDCLFADLGVDPGDGGCQLFEASNFLDKREPPNCRAHLVLFQIAMVGNHRTYRAEADAEIRCGLRALSESLAQWYPADHPLVVYEAAASPLEPHRAEVTSLSALPALRVSEVSSLYVPPCVPSPNLSAWARDPGLVGSEGVALTSS